MVGLLMNIRPRSATVRITHDADREELIQGWRSAFKGGKTEFSRAGMGRAVNAGDQIIHPSRPRRAHRTGP